VACGRRPRFTFNPESQRAGGQSVREQRQMPYDVNDSYGPQGARNADARATEREFRYGGMLPGPVSGPMPGLIPGPMPGLMPGPMPGPMRGPMRGLRRDQYSGGMPPPRMAHLPTYGNEGSAYLGQGRRTTTHQWSPYVSSQRLQGRGSTSSSVYANGRPSSGRFTYGPESQIGGGTTAVEQRSPYANDRSTNGGFTYGPDSQIGGGTTAVEQRVQQHSVPQYKGRFGRYE